MPGHQEPFDTGLRPDELDPQRPQTYDTPWGSLALYTVEGRVVAAQSFCPHLAGPLFQGSLVAELVTCPWHAWVFSLTTGHCLWAPEGAERVRSLLRRARVSVGRGGTFLIHPPDG